MIRRPENNVLFKNSNVNPGLINRVNPSVVSLVIIQGTTFHILEGTL
jgi:hypothetical protein